MTAASFVEQLVRAAMARKIASLRLPDSLGWRDDYWIQPSHAFGDELNLEQVAYRINLHARIRR